MVKVKIKVKRKSNYNQNLQRSPLMRSNLLPYAITTKATPRRDSLKIKNFRG